MSLEKIADKVVETDVLVMGGGIAGCPAAAKAAEHGLDVTLVEKSKPERSGSAGQGMDHYGAGARPDEGITPLELARLWEKWQSGINGDGLWGDPNIQYRCMDKGLWAVEELEKLGIPMRWDDGKFYWIPSIYPDSPKCMLRVHWQNVKPLMATAARKRGVNVLERTMVVDLLTNDGRVVGATAVNTRTGEFIVIKAKAVVIATGTFARCYTPETPLFYKYKFRYHWCPASLSGDGYVAAYRAGAELANMDITGWGFRIRDDLNISYGNFGLNEGIPGKQLTWDGEELLRKGFLSASKYAELEQKGKTPLYDSIEDLPEDWHKRIEVAFVDERMVSFKIAEDRGFNPRTHRYEMMPNMPHNFTTAPGIYTDEDFMARLEGVYSAGDCCAGLHGCGDASISGLLIGDGIYKFVSEAGEPVIDESQVESQKQVALAPLSVKDGTEPMELESAIRYICERYLGMFKSEGKLREGLRRLGSLRRVFVPKLVAKNPHYLMRCLEVRNIMDLAELHIQACLERKETRGNHIRLDYPEKDSSRDSMLTYQRMEEGKSVLEIRKVPELKPEYAKEGK